jgi:hypothetical protein
MKPGGLPPDCGVLWTTSDGLGRGNETETIRFDGAGMVPEERESWREWWLGIRRSNCSASSYTGIRRAFLNVPAHRGHCLTTLNVVSSYL